MTGRSRKAALFCLALSTALLLDCGRPSESTELPGRDAPSEQELREASRLRGAAIAKMRDGNWSQAEAELIRLQSLLPDNILPPINLAICFLQSGRRDKAREQIQLARQLDPDNAQMLFTFAAMLENLPDLDDEWREAVDHFVAKHPADPRPLYLLAQRASDPSAKIDYLQRALRLSPDTLVLMTDLLIAAAAIPDLETVSDALYAMEDRLDGFDGEVAERAEALRVSLDQGGEKALVILPRVLRNLLLPTEVYRSGLALLLGGQLDLFPQLDFDPPLPENVRGGQDIEVALVDASSDVGLAELPAIDSLILAGEPGEEWILAQHSGLLGRLETGSEEFALQPEELLKGPEGKSPAVSFDADFDGIVDLIMAVPGRGILIYPGRMQEGARSYAGSSVLYEGPLSEGIVGLHALDIDHDGDLDLFAARRQARDLYLRNSGDDLWTELAVEMGCAGEAVDTTDLAVFDIENDGDLDLLVMQPSSHPEILVNQRAMTLENASDQLGLQTLPAGLESARIADFDNDGRLDLLFFGGPGGRMLLNRRVSFEPKALPSSLDGPWLAADAADWDNDGDQDLIVVLENRGQVVLVRNLRGSFEAIETDLRAEQVESLVSRDLDHDGDLDFLVRSTDRRLRFWRNEGGNENNWLRLGFKGKNINNAKNNTQGLFTRIETLSGGRVQVQVGNGGINHFGLGSQRASDVVRIVWTNGVVQDWHMVAANQVLVEENVLKGSCPFLYAWNGSEFEFVTDLMWRSPLGMVLADGSPAPHRSARDYVLVPGDSITPVNDEIWLQVTEELWEVAYLDQQTLFAVDHPSDLELVVDERMIPPPYPESPPTYLVDQQILPSSAVDHKGRDQLQRVVRRDARYVDELPLTRYQGLTHGHSLELSFDEVPEGQNLRLLLWGWTFPTDTSINVALSQDSSRSLQGPRLERQEPDGSWSLLNDFIGFPNGKRKAMVVELPGRTAPGELRLRISTSLQIYWDAATLAVGEPPASAMVLTELAPVAADLHYRGFSRLYRESATGPHLFDYSNVSVENPFRPLLGHATSYGPVGSLLTSSDSQSAVIAAGDELTVRYDVSALPELPPGWQRDYVLFSDGWVKDGDINTTLSQTIEPLPYHGMLAYPDSEEGAAPDTEAYRAYLAEFQTRRIGDEDFRRGLQDSGDSE